MPKERWTFKGVTSALGIRYYVWVCADRPSNSRKYGWRVDAYNEATTGK